MSYQIRFREEKQGEKNLLLLGIKLFSQQYG